MDTTTPSPSRHWPHPTPNRIVIGLLAVEGLLLLSARFRWFAFNEHKGWTVLVALAAVGLTLLLLSLWFVAAPLFRRPFQYSLRSLLLLTVVVAIPFSRLATEMQRAREQRDTVAAIHAVGGVIEYDYVSLSDPPHDPFTPGMEPIEPIWLRKLVGDDFFCSIVHVFLNGSRITDTWLVHLHGLSHVQVLSLQGTKVTDAGLAHLQGLGQLRKLMLTDSKVTNEGVKKLQQALPHCKIQR